VNIEKEKFILMKNVFKEMKPIILKLSSIAIFLCLSAPSVKAQMQDATDVIQNAVLEGIQISSEAGAVRGEKTVTCYFIFKDKPSSYFYEIKKKNKKLVFEFNDTQKGTSPIPTSSEPPLEGFEIEQKKVDVNKEVKGLNQEWHDLVSVSFDLSKLPQIDVKDEYNVISFSYKWTTDQGKEKDYELPQDNRNKIVVLGTAGATGLIGGGLLWYFLNSKKAPEPVGPIPIDDLPSRKQ
jgi:hypothetical protein